MWTSRDRFAMQESRGDIECDWPGERESAKMGYWKGILLIFLIGVWTADGRSVPARQDLCNRLPQLSVCSGRSADTDAVVQSARANNADDGQQPSGGQRSQYCRRFQANFEYYCLGDGRSDPAGADFCPSYADVCGISTATAASGNKQSKSGEGHGEGEDTEAQLRQICLKYQPIAQKYCTGSGSEKGDVKENCDRYRSNCGALLVGGGNGGQSQPPKQQTPGCVQYQQLYFSRCASQNPTTQQEIAFCQNFASSCGPDDLLPPAALGHASPIEAANSEPPKGPPPSRLGSIPDDSVPPLPPSSVSQMSPGAMGGAGPGGFGGGGGGAGPGGFGGGGPMTIGSGTQVGNLVGTNQGTSIGGGGISTGRSVNAGPIGVTSGSGFDFGGLRGGGIPGLSGGIPFIGRRKRNVPYAKYFAYNRRMDT